MQTSAAWRALHGAPWWVYAIPLVALAAMLVAGEVGVWAAARDYKKQERDLARIQVAASAEQVRADPMPSCI